MAGFTREILVDNFNRAVVKWIYLASGNVAAAGLTGVVMPMELTGYVGPAGGTGLQIGLAVSKLFWSVPAGQTSESVELSWTDSGGNKPFLYLNGSGYANFSADGIPVKNGYTASTNTNGIWLANTLAMVSGESYSIIMEIDKNVGYSITACGG